MESHRQIADQAADLLLRRGSADWSSEDQVYLEAWLEASIDHRVAFLRLEAVWDDRAGALKTLGHGLPVGSVPPRGKWRQNPFFRVFDWSSKMQGGRSPSVSQVRQPAARSEQRVIQPEQSAARSEQPVVSPEQSAPRPERLVVRAGRRATRPVAGLTGRVATRVAIAASLAAVVVCGATYFLLGLGADRYSTPIGGIASVPLQDGSRIVLNTASEVRVAMSPAERRIDLEQGEAFFEVAKDAKRPFVVRAGDKRVIAVGTKFSVSRDGDAVRVVVTEGTVRLESASSPLHVESGAGSSQISGVAPVVALTAGTVARVRDQELLVQHTPVQQAEEILSWRDGFLSFHETPLAQVVAELNRYNVRKIKISDPAVASIRISGAFRPTSTEAFLRLLEEGYSLHAATPTAGDNTITLGQD